MTAYARVLIAAGFAVFVAAFTLPLHAQSGQDAAISRVENGLRTAIVFKGQPAQLMTLQSRMQYYHVRSLSIAFFDASGVKWARAYGASPSMLFQAGSISKPVSAVGIMRLVQEHRLALDRNVNDQLRSWKVPENAFTAKQPVTLRELLSHTAGMNVHGFEGYERGHKIPTLEQVLDGKPPANSPAIRVVMMPGKQYQYSGGGYVVAEQLTLDTVHEPFAKYMHDNVLAPLGMSDSTFEQPLPKALWNRASVAADGNGKAYPGDWNVYPEQTAAGLWTTPTDLAKFAIGMQRALNGAPGSVVSAATAREMLTPVKDGYGLGFSVEGSGRTARFGHDGANVGFQAAFVMHRNGQGVAIMTDSDNGISLITELMNSVAAVYGWSEDKPKQKTLYAMPPSQYARFTGTYAFEGGTLSVFERGGELYLTQPGVSPDRMYPESRDTFFFLDHDIDIRFTTDPSGAVTGATVLPFGDTLKKVTPSPAP